MHKGEWKTFPLYFKNANENVYTNLFLPQFAYFLAHFFIQNNVYLFDF